MAFTGTYELIISAVGVSIQSSIERTATQGIEPVDIDLPAGIAGSLTTRTSDTKCVIQVPTDHGIVQTDKVDVFWAGGLRYGIFVSASSATSITLDGDSGLWPSDGDVLPVVNTAVIVAKPTKLDCTFDGDNLVLIAVAATKRSHVRFFDISDATLKSIRLGASEAWAWASGTGVTNPLTGNPVAYIKASNGDNSGTSNIKITGLQYPA